MSANELIETWPGIAGANAAEIFGREAWAMPVGYNGNAAFALGTAEEKGLAPGDCLLVPEVGTEAPQWVTEPADDDLVHVLSAATTDLSFGDFADDSLPEPPAAATLILVRKGRTVAEGRLQPLGAQSAFAVEGLKG